MNENKKRVYCNCNNCIVKEFEKLLDVDDWYQFENECMFGYNCNFINLASNNVTRKELYQ